MSSYRLRRLYLLLSTTFLLSLIAFALIYMVPGEPLTALTRQVANTPEQHQELLREYHLNKPLWQQYFIYIGELFEGHWGYSTTNGEPVSQALLRYAPATLELCFYAITIGIIVGVPFGVWAALRRKKTADNMIISASLIGYSIPVYWWALLLIMIFALNMHWLPISGRIGLLFNIPERTHIMLLDILMAKDIDKTAALFSMVSHLILPTLAVSVVPATIMIRTTRSALLNEMERNYVHAARAKGLPRRAVVYRHILPNATHQILRQLGLLASPVLTSVMIIEVIFSWPGLGNWLLSSLAERDIPSLRGGFLAASLFVVCCNVLMDLLAYLSNPAERRGKHA